MLLSLLSLSAEGQLCDEEVGRITTGEPQTAAFFADRVYLGVGPSLRIFDLDSGATIGPDLALRGQVLDLATDGSMLYALTRRGVEYISLADPSAPERLATVGLEIPDTAPATQSIFFRLATLQVGDDFLAVSTQDGVTVLDKDTAAAGPVSNLPFMPPSQSSRNWPLDAALSSRGLLVAHDLGSFLWVDLADPNQPESSPIDLETNGWEALAHVEGDVFVVLHSGYDGSSTVPLVEAFDLADPAAPQSLWTWEEAGVQDVVARDGVLYLGGSYNGGSTAALVVLGAATRGGPVEIGRWMPGPGACDSCLRFSAGRIAVGPQAAVLLGTGPDYERGAQLVDLSNLAVPAHGWFHPAEYGIRAPWALNDQLLLQQTGSVLGVYSLANPAVPVEIAAAPGYFGGLLWADDQRIISGFWDVVMSLWSHQGDFDLEYHGYFAPSGGNLLQLDLDSDVGYLLGNTSFQLLDLSDVAAPVRLARRRVAGATQMVRQGLDVLIATAEGLAHYEVSNPSDPRRTWISREPSRGVVADGELAYVLEREFRSTTGMATFESTLRVLDLQQLTAPLELGHLELPDDVTGPITHRDSFLYLGGEKGLQVVDISDPAQPADLGLIGLPAPAVYRPVEAASHLYVPLGDTGMSILRCPGDPPPKYTPPRPQTPRPSRPCGGSPLCLAL